MQGTWRPIETIPKTLNKFLVARRYSKQIDYVEGFHAFNEPTAQGEHFFAFWLDAPERPPVQQVGGPLAVFEQVKHYDTE